MSKLPLALLILVACGPAVPDNPTYFDDVQPILRANCARCHGADPIDVKVAKYRLDRYVANDMTTSDAFDYRQTISEHTAAHMAPVMPPDYELSDRQQAILANWAAEATPNKGTRANTLGQIALISPQGTTTADQTIETTFRTWDADLDGLAVQLWARDEADPTQPLPLGAPTGGGERSVSIDSGTLASKHTFVIYAVVDDGFSDDPAVNEANKIPLIEALYVDHGLRGTAPTVKLTAPNDGGTQIGMINITWSATDPDVDANGNPDVLHIDLTLVRVDASGNEVSTMPIMGGLPNSPSSFAWTIPASVPATDANGPIPYKIRVTATDTLPTLAGQPANVRSDDSDLPFTIGTSTTTTYTWTDNPAGGGVGALFDKYCKQCHSQPPATPQLDPYCFIEYDQAHLVSPCQATDVGVYEMRSTVYDRVITTGNMPPASAQVKMTAADRQIIGNWLAGGAPYGGGTTSDPKPTFTWLTPSSNTALPATVSWSATDNSLETGKIELLNYAGNCFMPNCCANAAGTPTIIPLTDTKAMFSMSGATMWADSLALTKPTSGTGFYCVRGTVIDTAGQTTTVVNPAGLK